MKTIVLDCETTGLTMPSALDPAKQPQIIELAVAIIEDGVVIAEHEWLINPGCQLTEETTKITRITDDMLRDKPAFPAVLPEIKSAFAGADQLMAHNAPFDTACLTYELSRCGCADFPWPPDTICTVQEYVHEFGRRPRLIELYEKKIGKPLDQKHRAMDDVRALVEILLKEELA